MTLSKEDISAIAAETVKKERRPLGTTIILFIIVQIFAGGVLYAQIQDNTRDLNERKKAVNQIPLIVQKLEAVEQQGKENKKEVKEVQRVQQQILLEIRDLSTQLRDK